MEPPESGVPITESAEALVKEALTRICALVVGLRDVKLLGVEDEFCGPLALHIWKWARLACGACVRQYGPRAPCLGLVDLATTSAPGTPCGTIHAALPGNEKRRHSLDLVWALSPHRRRATAIRAAP